MLTPQATGLSAIGCADKGKAKHTEVKRAIVRVLEECGASYTSKEMCARLAWANPNTVRGVLSRLKLYGAISCVDGRYSVRAQRSPSDVSEGVNS